VTEYLDIPFESDPDALAQVAIDYLQAVIPNWVPAEGNLDMMFIRSISHIAAEVQDISSAVPTTIFRYYGANVINIPPQEAVAAQGLTTWTMRDTAGYTIPAGTLIALLADGSTQIGFQVLNDAVVAPGSLAISAVPIEAVVPGAAGSALNGDVQLIDALGFVQSITLDTPTFGGVDAESDDDYLARLVLDLQLMAPRPILPQDFAAMATSIAGVGRALAIDGYNPADGSYNNPRMIAVAAVDNVGVPVAGSIMTDIQTFLDGQREVNFVVNVIAPTVTLVDVTYSIKGLPGFDDANDLVTRTNQAISDYLDPATWGIPQSGDTNLWINENTVRYLSLSNAIMDVQGVRYIEALTLGLHGGSLASADLVLPGVAVLADAGTLTGSADLT
jgi:hypothetical protein